jgi:hypothetical protein
MVYGGRGEGFVTLRRPAHTGFKAAVDIDNPPHGSLDLTAQGWQRHAVTCAGPPNMAADADVLDTPSDVIHACNRPVGVYGDGKFDGL